MSATEENASVSSFEGEVRKPKGAVLFTGPDGVGDHRVRVEEQHYIGHTTASPEATADLKYIVRAPKNCPHPPPKMRCAGEIGWGVTKFADPKLLKTGHQIQLKEFRQADEDRYTHRYQAPYYPLETDTDNSPTQEAPTCSRQLKQQKFSPQTTDPTGSDKNSLSSITS